MTIFNWEKIDYIKPSVGTKDLRSFHWGWNGEPTTEAFASTVGAMNSDTQMYGQGC